MARSVNGSILRNGGMDTLYGYESYARGSRMLEIIHMSLGDVMGRYRGTCTHKSMGVVHVSLNDINVA